MRIALTHAYSWPEVRRGAERIIRELGSAMAERGHSVTILTAGSTPGRRVEDGVTTIRLRRHFDDPVRHERELGVRLVPHLVRGRFDAVHSFGPWDCVAAIRAARMRRRGRTVYTNLGVPDRTWSETSPDRKPHLRIVHDVDVYGCMSRYAAEALQAEYGRAAELTPGGVNLERFGPAADREPEPTVLFSGAITETRKGVGTLLQAIALLAEARPTIRLWLSGPGDPRSLLAAAPPAARDRTELLGLGEPDEQHVRYGRAWVTALPSTWDSFGQALVESLACGTPLVVTTHGAPRELVEPGTTGALSEPGDAESLAQALDKALALAVQPNTAEACRRAAEPFDWRTGLAPRFERLYSGA